MFKINDPFNIILLPNFYPISCQIPVIRVYLQAEWKTVWILISCLLRSQLIWIYTVFIIGCIFRFSRVRVNSQQLGFWYYAYSKTCVKRLFIKRPKIGFQDQLSLNAGQKYCRMLQGEHSAILLTFIKLPFVIKIFVLSIFEWPFYIGFTVCVKSYFKHGRFTFERIHNTKEQIFLLRKSGET